MPSDPYAYRPYGGGASSKRTARRWSRLALVAGVVFTGVGWILADRTFGTALARLPMSALAIQISVSVCAGLVAMLVVNTIGWVLAWRNALRRDGEGAEQARERQSAFTTQWQYPGERAPASDPSPSPSPSPSIESLSNPSVGNSRTRSGTLARRHARRRGQTS
ncbi:MAG: hypothetical protein K0U93_06540 [Gammaproteobacteria bacterium]|nr:hypothetical protein [Gammaproteobacteria bacterium]